MEEVGSPSLHTVRPAVPIHSLSFCCAYFHLVSVIALGEGICVVLRVGFRNRLGIPAQSNITGHTHSVGSGYCAQGFYQ